MKNFGNAIKNFVQNTILGSTLYTLMCISIFFLVKPDFFALLFVSFYTLVGVLNTVYLVVKAAKEDK